MEIMSVSIRVCMYVCMYIEYHTNNNYELGGLDRFLKVMKMKEKEFSRLYKRVSF